MAYQAKTGAQWRQMVDERGGPEFDDIYLGSTYFLPGGKHTAYYGRQGTKWFAVIDGQPGPAYDGIAPGSLIGGRNGEHIAYTAISGGKQSVVVDGRAGPEYDAVLKNGPIFMADGALEYLAIKNDGVYQLKNVPTQTP